MRVLLVDDEVLFISILAERLTERKLFVRTAHSVNEALHFLAQESFDVAVLDVCMPGRDGIDLLRVMRERHPDVQVLMLTGSSDVQAAIDGLRLGAYNYLLKPVDIDVLLRELQRAFERKLQRNEQARLIATGQLAALGRMAEGVAHEINNPLNTLINASGWIEDILTEPEFTQSSNAPEMIRTLRVIKEQSFRVRAITRKLLCFGRGLDPRPVPFHCADVLRELMQEVEVRATTLSVTMHLDIPDNLSPVFAPPVEMRQAFLHVIENALDAMEETGGQLVIKARALPCSPERTTPCLHLSFTDTGHGIPPELIDRVFDPFFSTRCVGKGSGLGLSVCYGVVQSIGGSMSILSDPGRTVCSMTLPFHIP